MNTPRPGLVVLLPRDPRAELRAGRRDSEVLLWDGETSIRRGGFRRGVQD